MNTNTSIFNSFLALALAAAAQPCWAQVIDSTTELKSSQPLSKRNAFGVRNTGMIPEVNRPGAIDSARRAELRHMSPNVIEQIGKLKQSMPSQLGVP